MKLLKLHSGLCYKKWSHPCIPAERPRAVWEMRRRLCVCCHLLADAILDDGGAVEPEEPVSRQPLHQPHDGLLAALGGDTFLLLLIHDHLLKSKRCQRYLAFYGQQCSKLPKWLGRGCGVNGHFFPYFLQSLLPVPFCWSQLGTLLHISALFSLYSSFFFLGENCCSDNS